MITKDDIKAFKLAESVSLYYYEKAGTIVLRIEQPWHDVPRIFTATEQRLFPEVDMRERHRTISVDTFMSGYTDDGGTAWNLENSLNAVGYASITSPRYDLEWQTVIGLLRDGDSLTLRWTADNNNETIRKAGLHVDTVSLDVKRANSRGSDVMGFHIDTAITPDNSARMIKRHGGF